MFARLPADDGTDDELVRVRIVHYPLVLLHRQPRRVDVLARRAGVGEPHLAPAAHALVDAEGCREVLLGCRQHTVVVILEAAVVGAITHHRLHRGPAVERKLRHRHRFELDRVGHSSRGLMTRTVPVCSRQSGPEFTFGLGPRTAPSWNTTSYL